MPTSPTDLLKDVVRRMPPGLQRRVRDLARPGRGTLVSIVVPVYNVERYIEDCLVSIQAQTHRKLEIVVVDDGSPDGSMRIVERLAAKDRRIRLVRQENQGLGAARNTGVRHARGELITFMDSDDEMHPRAIEVMVATLTKSGSDFAVGALIRRTPAGDHTPKWVREVHDVTRTRRTILDEPEIVKNVFAPTKVYRTKFFREVVGEFPSGGYEDQVPAAKAYLNGTFDIVRNRLIYWRIRDDSTSITQQKADLSDLETRWRVIRGIEEAVQRAPKALRVTYEAKAIGFDMRPYFEQVPRTEPVYWETLRREMRAFVDGCGYARLADVPVADRLLAAATYHGLEDDVAELISRREVRTWAVPGEVVDGRARIAAEYFEGLQLKPDDVICDLSVDVHLADRVAQWEFNEGSVSVTGVAFLRGIDLAGASSSISVELRAKGKEPVQAVVERHSDDYVDRWALDAWNSYAPSGFSARFSLADLDADARYSPWVTVEVNGLTFTGPLAEPDRSGSGALPSVGPLDAHGRWSVSTDSSDGRVILRHVRSSHAAVTDLKVDGGTLEFAVAPGVSASSFVASRGAALVRGTTFEREGTTWVSFSLPMAPARSTEPRKWHFAALIAGTPRPLSWQHASAALARVTGAGLVPTLNSRGELVALAAHALCAISSARFTAKGLELSGWASAPEGGSGATIRLVSEHAAGTAVDLDLPAGGGHFVTVLPVRLAEGAPVSKDFGFLLEFVAGAVTAPVRAMPSLVATMPADLSGPKVNAVLTVTAKAASVWVRFQSRIAAKDISRFGQAQLIRAYQSAEPPLEEAVLFESFAGTTISDSPLGLSTELHVERPNLRQFWSVACLTTPVPAWATPLVRFSPEWYTALASARYLVNNNNWPWFFAKRAGQRYVQTWHGTPLKRIGYDVPQGNLTLTYRKLMVREAHAWDFLLAQNDFAADVLPRAFGYDGAVLNVGYPRNDSLVGETAIATRKAIRRRLGIGQGVRAILYAPTWRDNIVGARGYGRVSFLDVEALAAASSEAGTPTVVLYRGHFNTLRSAGAVMNGVIDVSGYPDVNDVILASDALVTDYSSIMFDYPATGRPVYLLVPDLELYSSKTRGFYMDIDEVAPGPLCANTDELIARLEEPFWEQYGARYERFVRDFLPRDDGHAAERVIAVLTADDALVGSALSL